MKLAAVRRRFEIGSLVVLLLVVGGLAAFGALMSEVIEGDTAAFDEVVFLAMRVPGDPATPLGSLGLQEFMRDVSGLGGIGILTAVTISAAILLWLMRDGRTAVFLVLAVSGGTLVSTGFKMLVDRPRPDLVPYGAYVHTASFPSGHSMMSAVVYLTLAVLVCRTQSSMAVRIYLMTLATALTIAVGVSRVYLGVHWPTDVLAGWALGSAWAIGCAVLASWLGRRGRIEAAVSEDEHIGVM